MDFYAAFAYCIVRGVHEAECKVEVRVLLFLGLMTAIIRYRLVYLLEALTIHHVIIEVHVCFFGCASGLRPSESAYPLRGDDSVDIYLRQRIFGSWPRSLAAKRLHPKRLDWRRPNLSASMVLSDLKHRSCMYKFRGEWLRRRV